MSVIRDVVRAFRYPLAAPHVYTGVESTIPLLARVSAASAPETPSKRQRRSIATAQLPASELSHARVLALVAVTLLYVLSRMMDQDITPDQYLVWRSKAVFTLLKSKAGQDIAEETIVSEIEQLMPMVQEEGWLSMEWFLNIAPPDHGDEMEGVDGTNDAAATGQKRSRGLKGGFGSEYIGLGTMMQDATDYLGERQRADYKRWKAGIVARLEEIESS